MPSQSLQETSEQYWREKCFLLEIWLNWVRCILQSRSTPCTPLCMKCGEGYFRHLVSSPRRVLSLHLVVSTIYVMWS